MAKVKSFKLNEKEKTITIFTNIEQSLAEKNLIEFYLNKGFIPFVEEKKKGITVDEMRKELAGTEELKEFNRLYKSKEKGEGFHSACKVYNKWKKENK